MRDYKRERERKPQSYRHQDRIRDRVGQAPWITETDAWSTQCLGQLQRVSVEKWSAF